MLILRHPNFTWMKAFTVLCLAVQLAEDLQLKRSLGLLKFLQLKERLKGGERLSNLKCPRLHYINLRVPVFDPASGLDASTKVWTAKLLWGVSSVLTDESASQIITPPYPHETRHFFIK
jgi:hypothetical protein